MAMSSLTALERETVVTMNDEEDFVSIHTAQKPVITSLKKNPAAELLEEGTWGTTAWANFKLPKGLITFRSGKKKVSTANQKGFAKRMASAKKCSATTAAGKPCQGKAINGSGKCFKHK